MTPIDRKNTATAAVLAPVLEKFPEVRAKIRQLYLQSSAFKSLCEDYRDCLAAWHYWQKESLEDAPALRQSYAELLQELEQDFRQYLELEE